MAYEICKRCERLFEKTGIEYCNDCYEQNRNDYKIVLEYINTHADTSVMDIVAATGVSLQTINNLVEDWGISYKDDKMAIKNEKDKPSDFGSENKIPIKRSKFHSRRR